MWGTGSHSYEVEGSDGERAPGGGGGVRAPQGLTAFSLDCRDQPMMVLMLTVEVVMATVSGHAPVAR